jgi:4-hydroxy-tetrahydrodipicolinate synthase
MGTPHLRGVLAALVTPVDRRGHLDEDGLGRLLQRVFQSSAQGVSPVGTTGEGPSLAVAFRRNLVSKVRELAPRSARVIPGVIETSPTAVQREINAFAERGADAALVALPHYYPMSQAAILRFYESAADRSPLPIVIYNMPRLTKSLIEPATVGRLAGHPNIIAEKDSSGNLEHFVELVAACEAHPEFGLLTGTDSLLLPSLVMGGDGAIAASVNLAPSLSCGIYDSFRNGEIEAARNLQMGLLRLVLACRSSSPAGWKAALKIAGVCSDEMAPPTLKASPDEQRRIGETLLDLDHLISSSLTQYNELIPVGHVR